MKVLTFESYCPLLERFLSLLQEEMGEALVGVVLYGSLARNQVKPDSDIDLLVVGRGSKGEVEEGYRHACDALEETPEYRALVKEGIWPSISPFIVTDEYLRQNTPWLLLEIQDHGLFLYDPEGFLAWKIEQVRERMRELGTKKVMLPDGSWYWDVKPDWKPGEVFEL
ncbi:MAG: nucleotidyltransferase domain-containing protein [Anaerolineae bacterium]